MILYDLSYLSWADIDVFLIEFLEIPRYHYHALNVPSYVSENAVEPLRDNQIARLHSDIQSFNHPCYLSALIIRYLIVGLIETLITHSSPIALRSGS